ncbi:MAG: hypothetical protein ACRCXZ_02940 [Patescibacteria group bacterium]
MKRISFKSKKKFGNIENLNFAKSEIGIFNFGLYSLLDYLYFDSLNQLLNLKYTQKANGFKQVFVTLSKFNAVENAVNKIKKGAYFDFGKLVNTFFEKVKEIILPIFSRRELGNELLILKDNKENVVINIDHEKLAVRSFIKKIGLDNINITHLNVNEMLEAIRMYEIGDHQLFKAITLKCVNKALLTIERSLISMDDKSRMQALTEMNGLDTLKFMVELIAEESSLELTGVFGTETLALPWSK